MYINGHEYELKKHVGKLNNTGTRVIVVFRTVPGDPTHCLVVEADHLPDMYADNINSIVKSRQAQETNDLYDVLNRRTFSDGGNCLQTLHHMNFLRKVPVEQVDMLPLPGRAVPLSAINNEIDGTPQDSYVETNVEAATVDMQVSDLSADQLLTQAKELEDKAAALKEEAYVLEPDLRPGRGRPQLTATEKQQRKQDRNAKRRETYAKKKSET